jgi:hypothetical protein
MLKNERYIGKPSWGRTKQRRNPETGKMVSRDLAPELWERMDHPELRIVSDELWTRVQEQTVKATRGFGVQRLGGMNRTEASRKYLFGGLLVCGVCGGRIIVVTTNPARYGCANHREARNCLNKATVPLELLERLFLSALADKLRADELREELIHGVVGHLRVRKAESLRERDAFDNERSELEATQKALTEDIGNFVSAVRNGSSSRALLAELDEAEAKLGRVTERLATATKTPDRDVPESEVRAFVNAVASSFLDILLGDPVTVKHEFRKRISSITLTPSVDERGPVYTVSGDVALFSSQEGALQDSPLELIGLQYTIPISFEVIPYRHRRKWEANMMGSPRWDRWGSEPGGAWAEQEAA